MYYNQIVRISVSFRVCFLFGNSLHKSKHTKQHPFQSAVFTCTFNFNDEIYRFHLKTFNLAIREYLNNIYMQIEKKFYFHSSSFLR